MLKSTDERGQPIGWSLNRNHVTRVATLTPAEGSMATLREKPIQLTLKALMDPKSKFIRNAISRWAKSKDTDQNFADKFIDLRIALESLYPNRGNNADLSFRLALSGAWHLGKNLAGCGKTFSPTSKRNIYDDKAV